MLGICGGGRLVMGGPNSLKRDLLFFDKLVILGGRQLITVLRTDPSTDNLRQFADEYEYLLDTPFFDASTTEEVLSRLLRASDGQSNESLDPSESWFRSIEESIERLSLESETAKPAAETAKEISDLRNMQVSLITRLEAERLSAQGQLATSNEPMARGKLDLGFAPCAGDIIQLSIDLVPVPDDLTSWEEIFALRQDKDVVDRARKLRLWAIDQAQSHAPLPEISERIADLLADYERALKSHKIKYTSSVMRSVIVGTAGVLEDILKLRFEKAATRFFSVKTSRADMLLAEANAVGKELSLVTTLRDKFRKS